MKELNLATQQVMIHGVVLGFQKSIYEQSKSHVSTTNWIPIEIFQESHWQARKKESP